MINAESQNEPCLAQDFQASPFFTVNSRLILPITYIQLGHRGDSQPRDARCGIEVAAYESAAGPVVTPGLLGGASEILLSLTSWSS